MVEYEGKDDGWPENGSQCRMIAKCEKGWEESGRGAIKWVRGWISLRNELEDMGGGGEFGSLGFY